MNQNRPFFSVNTNLYDESFRSSAPATLNGQNVIFSQEQQRRIFDTLNTEIFGNNFGLNNCPGNINVLHAQKQFYPGGVMFTFNQQQPQYIAPGKCAVPNTDQNNFQSGVNTFFPSSLENQVPFGGIQPCVLDYLKSQQVPKNQYQLKFHNDSGTSCSDLLSHYTQVPASQGYPDLCNLNGVLQQNQVNHDSSQMSNNPLVFFPSPPIEFSSNAKKLVLSKNIAPCGHVVDHLEGNEKNNIKRRVCFSEDHIESSVKSEKCSQICSPCICMGKKYQNKSKNTKKQQNDDPFSTDEDSMQENPEEKNEKTKKDNKQRKSKEKSCNTPVSSDGEHKSDPEKPRKLRWWSKREKKDTSSLSDTSDTETEKSESNEKERKRNKNRKKNNRSNLSVNFSDESNISDASSTSEENTGKCKPFSLM